MTLPTKYVVSYNFANWQAVNPSKPLPGPQVDIQLADIASSLGETIDALGDVRRSDGKLNNGVVDYDSLASDLKAQIGIGLEQAVTDTQAAQTAAESAATAAAASAVTAAAAAGTLQGTSATSVAMATGTKVFTTQSGKQFTAGTPLTIASAANPTVNAMYGVVSSYVGTTLTMSIDSFIGSGTYADWVIIVSGKRGAQGAPGSAGAGTGDMLKADNLSGLGNVATARGNLGLGTAAVLDTDVDGTLAANSDSKISTQKAVKTYVTTQIAACLASAKAYADGLIAALTKSSVGLSNVQNVDQTNASNLSSGAVATARLGTGTADATTFLRGDGTWSSPSTSTPVGGGVGSYAILTYTKVGGTVNNNATFTEDGSSSYFWGQTVTRPATNSVWKNVSGTQIQQGGNATGLFYRTA